MIKKLLYLFLCFSVVFSFNSCTSEQTGIEIKEPVKIAVCESSAEMIAGTHDAVLNGYTLEEYSTLQGAIIATQNGKADYVLINSDTATNAFLNNSQLIFHKNIEYKTDYCVVMSKKNEALLTEINSAIRALKKDGTFTAIDEGYRTGEKHTVISGEAPNGKIKILCAPVFDERLYLTADGEPSGCELDYIKAICNYLGKEPDIKFFQQTDEMFVALEQNEDDIIISAVEYTNERAEQYLLSEPYASTTYGLYKRK